METVWYFRLFYIPILSMIISGLLTLIIRPKRMGMPELSRPMHILSMISFIVPIVLMWFVTFSINAAFWIGICIIVFGHVLNSLAYSAMREHPGKKKVVVDWGIYKVTRHPHFLHSVITTLGAIVIGWNWSSTIYIILWVYLVLDIIFNHFAILMEEKRTAEKLGQEYVDYMERVPRYILVRG